MSTYVLLSVECYVAHHTPFSAVHYYLVCALHLVSTTA